MSTIYPEGTFKIIPAEVVVAGTMYVNRKLNVTFEEIVKMRKYLSKRLKESNIQGYARFDSEAIMDMQRENDSFIIANKSISCRFWNRVEDILSWCDTDVLYFLFDYKKKINESVSSSYCDDCEY